MLLIEDNPADVRLIQELLYEGGASWIVLDHVDRLAAALDYLAQEAVDVIVLDLSLPDGQGLENIAKISRVHSETPLIVLTGHDSEETGLEAVRQGAQDYLVKGHVDGRLLARAIRYAKERKEQQAFLRETMDRVARSEKLATIGQLSAGVAHDLRNPLATIIQAIRHIRNRLQGIALLTEEPTISKFFDLIEGEVERVDRTIEDLTDFSRTKPPSQSPVLNDVEPLLNAALSYAKTNGSVKIISDLHEGLPPCRLARW